MRILQIGKFYPPHLGGIETVMYDLAQGLKNRGVVCDVLCSNKTALFVKELSEDILVTRTPSYGIISSTSISPRLIAETRAICDQYDLIHCHLPDPLATVAILMSGYKGKVVLHWHSDIIKQKMALKFFLPFQRALIERADRIVATSPPYIEGSTFLSAARKKTVSIPIGTDTSWLHAYDEKFYGQITQKYQGKKIIFSLGRLTYYKGFRYLIDAAEHLNDDFVVIIGGEGSLRSDLLAYIRKKNLLKKVELVGKIGKSELGAYYNLCDIFCLPSIERSEAFGVVLIEAMSFGKPIVATNIPGSGTSWVNKHGVTGLNVECRRPDQIAKACEQLLLNRDMYTAYSSAAKNRYYELFSRENMVAQIQNEYSSLLQKDASKDF